MVKFLEEKKTKIPHWLHNNYCPYNSKEEWDVMQNSKKMIALQQLLEGTMKLQAKFIVLQFNRKSQKFLNNNPKLKEHFSCVAQDNKPHGIFALIDYTHFKGWGTNSKERYDDYGWGLKQVLKQMRKYPITINALCVFSKSAQVVLKKRVKHAPPEKQKNEQKWLKGWVKRVESYWQD